jgi:hexosaminidase
VPHVPNLGREFTANSQQPSRKLVGVNRPSPSAQTSNRPSQILLLAAGLYLLLNLFASPITPFLLGGDQTFFWLGGQRMSYGERVYLDFLRFTPPGTDLAYCTLFKLFGPRVWVTNLVVLAAGLAFTWQCFTIAAKIMPRRAATLATALFLVAIYGKPLNMTNHWFSALAIAFALKIASSQITPATLAVSAALLGLASFFNHAHGAAALLAFALFLLLRHPRTQDPPITLARNLAILFAAFALTLALLSAPLIAQIGLRKLWYFQVTYVMHYAARLTQGETLGLPGTLTLRSLPKLSQYIAVYLALPIAYLVSLWRCWRERNNPPSPGTASPCSPSPAHSSSSRSPSATSILRCCVSLQIAHTTLYSSLYNPSRSVNVLSRAFILTSALFMSSLLPGQTFTNTLLPQPAHITTSEGSLPWGSVATIGIPHHRDARLEAALDRTLQQIHQETGTAKPTITTAEATLTLDVDGPGQTIQSLDEDESYTLAVTPTNVRIHAATVVGAMRALATLQQLVQQNPGDKSFFLPAVTIEDTPRFRWRGLMIDTGRHFEPVEVIKRNLDAMAAVKLNVFHWHLSEDQGFRIQSKIYPQLTGKGSDGLFYTQQQARDIIAYARARGIRVIPEFDMPGHTRSWFVGYPLLASAHGPYTIRREFGIDDAAMDPTRESTYQFLDRFLGEMAALFPDPYMHVGGDESNGKQWMANPRVRSFMRTHHLKDTAALQTYFESRVLEILTKHHKHMVGWDEILNPALPKDAIIQSWRGPEGLFAAARDGHQAILSQPYYLDGMKSAKEHYQSDPIPPDSGLTPEQQALILGGETCMWGEHLNSVSIDSRIWPRTAAIAERLWSPQSVNDVDDMYRRLAIESIRLENLGLTHLSHTNIALRQLAADHSALTEPLTVPAGTKHAIHATTPGLSESAQAVATQTPAAPTTDTSSITTTQLEALRTFAEALEPVPFHDRYQAQRTDQLTPLNNFVDAIVPDPPSRHKTAKLTREFRTNPTTATEQRDQLAETFRSWIAAVPTVQSLMNNSPRLAEVRPRAEQLTALSNIGLEALNYISTGTPPANWKQTALAQIEAAQKPQVLVRFTFLPALTDLVNAAAK